MTLDYQREFAGAQGYEQAVQHFHSLYYLRLNQRRQEHLATLGLPLAGKHVWEVSAGIGDHTTFFIDRECQVLCTEARPELAKCLSHRFPNVEVRLLDLDDPVVDFPSGFDLIYCYGVLYHLRFPGKALAFLAARCREILLIETCVGAGDEEAENPVDEPKEFPSQAVSGKGCRPSRAWVFSRLKSLFPHVYVPVTQPWHEQFPVDWGDKLERPILERAVFVASRVALDNSNLSEELPMKQIRH
jgi:hypothetical protein